MKKYIVIYHAAGQAMEKIKASNAKGAADDKKAWEKMKDAKPEDMKDGMKAWMDWAAKCGDGLVDMGAPLANGQKVTSSGNSASDKGVVGYSILQADSMDGALAMLKEHPHLAWTEGCEIEVHETMDMPS